MPKVKQHLKKVVQVLSFKHNQDFIVNVRTIAWQTESEIHLDFKHMTGSFLSHLIFFLIFFMVIQLLKSHISRCVFHAEITYVKKYLWSHYTHLSVRWCFDSNTQETGGKPS